MATSLLHPTVSVGLAKMGLPSLLGLSTVAPVEKAILNLIYTPFTV